jgi:hypothetical protein
MMEEILKSLSGLGPVGIVLALSVYANIAQWKRNNSITDSRLEDFKKHAELKAASDQRQFEVMSTMNASITSLSELIKMGKKDA